MTVIDALLAVGISTIIALDIHIRWKLWKLDRQLDELALASDALKAVQGYVETEAEWLTASAADGGHHPLLDAKREDLRKLLRGEP